MPDHEVIAVPSTPFTLLERALEKGIDADQLERLVGLFERWQENKARQEYAAAMQACQAEMPVVVRNKYNDGSKSKYAPLEEVHAAIKGTCLKHGFTLSFGETPSSKEGQCGLYCDVRHVGGHVERHTLEGALDTTGMKGGANKTDIQGKGSTVSYLRRYLTLMIFDVTVANEDFDGNAREQLVGPEEIRQINEMIEECDQAGHKVDFDKFIKWLGVPSLEQLTLKGFAKAVWELRRKKKGQPKKAVAT